jgi:AraC-like DNA-binding protein
MLEGKDLTWKRLIGQNLIHFTDLKPGNYVLHIRNAGSLESENTITIIKKRPYSLYLWLGASLLIILTGIYFYRVQFIKLSSLKNLIIDNSKKKSDNKQEKEKYKNSRLEEEESVSIRNAIVKYMEEEQPYLNPKLKLADLSAAIKCPQTKVSQVLNQNLEISFADFVNKYRVEEFKKLAQSNIISQYTLTALSEKCGFNSRSSFFHVFKKITGQTPFEYLKESDIILDKEK